MLGFFKSNASRGPVFIVGSSSLFSKNELAPNEFGREITRLGFNFGIAQFEQYQKANSTSPSDVLLLREVEKNPGFIQLLYANLITGAFFCYAKVPLKADTAILAAIEAGILIELRSTMPNMSDKILGDHVHIIENFAIAIEREIGEIEEDSSVKLLYQYLTDFYPNLVSVSNSSMPIGLANLVSGLGSRFMALCQNEFKLSLRLK